jgi:hypothetical protein
VQLAVVGDEDIVIISLPGSQILLHHGLPLIFRRQPLSGRLGVSSGTNQLFVDLYERMSQGVAITEEHCCHEESAATYAVSWFEG